MNTRAPRSIDEYLKQLAVALHGQNPSVIREALEASAEYLRSEVAACPDKSEGDVLELITSTYGAPEEVAAVYPLETQTRVVRVPFCRCFPCQQERARWPRPRAQSASWSGAAPHRRR